MAIDLLDEFASSGTKTEPTESKIADGYSGGEQPAADEANWLFNVWTKKINEIAQKADPTPATVEMSNVIQKYYPPDSTWSTMDDEQNKISLSTSKGYLDFAVYLNSSGEKRIMALRSTDDRTIDIINPETMAVVDTSDEIGTELPYSVINPWCPTAFCTDGTYIYVTFFDQDDPANYRISAYNISDWSLKSGWPAEGAELPGTGLSGYSLATDGAYPGKIIFANETTLAVLCSWNAVTASNSGAVCFVSVDNTQSSFTAGTDYGAGDAPTGDSVNGVNGITSDGTTVYYTGWGTTNNYLCSVSIADPTSGGGGTGYPLTYSDAVPLDLIFTGRLLVTALTPAGDDAALYTCTPESAYGAELNKDSSGRGRILRVGQLTFDGLNVWGRARSYGGASEYCEYLIKINVEACYDYNFGSAIVVMAGTIGDYTFSKYSFTPNPDVDEADDAIEGVSRIFFDGRDMWALHSMNYESEYDGLLRRLPLAAFR